MNTELCMYLAKRHTLKYVAMTSQRAYITLLGQRDIQLAVTAIPTQLVPFIGTTA